MILTSERKSRTRAPGRGGKLPGFRITLIGWVACAVCTLMPPFNVAAEPENAEDYLEFESIPDGRCQILSMGGKLRLLHNRHPELAIRFRLVRMFAGNHPQGRSTGAIAAGGKPTRLGCTRVDGRDQDWIIERASFAEGETD